MNHDKPPGSRFAELSAELLGSKLAADLIREIWAGASPDVKQELADAVLRHLGEQFLAVENYTLRSIAEQAIRSAAVEEASRQIEALRPEIAPKIKQYMAANFEDAIEKRAHQELNEVLAKVRRETCR